MSIFFPETLFERSSQALLWLCLAASASMRRSRKGQKCQKRRPTGMWDPQGRGLFQGTRGEVKKKVCR